MNDYSESESCDMAQDLKDARQVRDAEIPMPDMTTTEKLMSPGPNEEVEG